MVYRHIHQIINFSDVLTILVFNIPEMTIRGKTHSVIPEIVNEKLQGKQP